MWEMREVGTYSAVRWEGHNQQCSRTAARSQRHQVLFVDLCTDCKSTWRTMRATKNKQAPIGSQQPLTWSQSYLIHWRTVPRKKWTWIIPLSNAVWISRETHTSRNEASVVWRTVWWHCYGPFVSKHYFSNFNILHSSNVFLFSTHWKAKHSKYFDICDIFKQWKTIPVFLGEN